MTTVTFFKQNNQFVGLKVIGHSGYAKQGKDIVCASVSSVTQMVGAGIEQFITKDVKIEVNQTLPSYVIQLPKNLTQQQYSNVDILMQSAYVFLKQLSMEYSKNLNVEVTNNVY